MFLGTGGNRGVPKPPKLVDFAWGKPPMHGPPEPPPQASTAVLDGPETVTTWTAEPVEYRPVGLTADPNGRLELNGRCRHCGRRIAWCDEMTFRPENGQWVPDQSRVLPFDVDGRRHDCRWDKLDAAMREDAAGEGTDCEN